MVHLFKAITCPSSDWNAGELEAINICVWSAVLREKEFALRDGYLQYIIYHVVGILTV